MYSFWVFVCCNYLINCITFQYIELEIYFIFIFILFFGVYFYWNRTVSVRSFEEAATDVNSPLLRHVYMWQSTVINWLHLTEIKISVFSSLSLFKFGC